VEPNAFHAPLLLTQHTSLLLIPILSVAFVA
jgi:hypothetical protein